MLVIQNLCLRDTIKNYLISIEFKLSSNEIDVCCPVVEQIEQNVIGLLDTCS